MVYLIVLPVVFRAEGLKEYACPADVVVAGVPDKVNVAALAATD